MSLPNYFSAVDWIAEHDGKNGMGALEPPAVACRPTVALLAQMYGMRQEAVANDVVARRLGKPEPASEPEKLKSNTKDSTTVAVSNGKVCLNGRELVLPPKASYGLK
jgi:hypothetical protein